MNFFDLDNYNLESIESLIKCSVEESIHLDYKASGALDKSKKDEIAKDVSSFANSDGGIIVYGILENHHVPQDFSPIDGEKYTKEWIEQVINSNIKPRISGIRIYPIRLGNDIAKTVYVVKIPRSSDAPHMSSDSRYYKRFNFTSVRMEEYEVRDLFNRIENPILELDDMWFERLEDKSSLDIITYRLSSSISNFSKNICLNYKLSVIIHGGEMALKPIDTIEGVSSQPNGLPNDAISFSIINKEPIFPKERLDLGNINFKINRDLENIFRQSAFIQLILRYPGGYKTLGYDPFEEKLYENEEKFEEVINYKKKHFS